MTPAEQAEDERLSAGIKRAVGRMSDAKLCWVLFHSIWESAERRDRAWVAKQLRREADRVERGIVH